MGQKLSCDWSPTAAEQVFSLMKNTFMQWSTAKLTIIM